MDNLDTYHWSSFVALLLLLPATSSLGQDKLGDELGSRVPEQLIAEPEPRSYKAGLQSEAANWTSYYVSPSYLPPKNSRYVILSRKSEKEWDKVQLSYKAEDSLISIVQSRYIFTFQIENANWPEESPLGVKTIEKTARDIFVGASKLELTVTNSVEGNAKPGNFVDAPWLESLCWKKKGNTLIFMWVKIPRGPSSIYIPASYLKNAYWFSEPAKTKGTSL